MLNNVLPLWTLPLCEEHSQVLKMQLQAGAEIPLLPPAALISRALPELRVAFQALTKRDRLQSSAAQRCLPCEDSAAFSKPTSLSCTTPAPYRRKDLGLGVGFSPLYSTSCCLLWAQPLNLYCRVCGIPAVSLGRALSGETLQSPEKNFIWHENA